MSKGALFAHRDFRLLLLGQTTSQLGAQVSGVAIPLLALLEFALVPASSTLDFAVIGRPAPDDPLAASFRALTLAHLRVPSLPAGIAETLVDVGRESRIPSGVDGA